MLFQVGNRVCHPMYGVGSIETVENKVFLGNETRLYYQVRTEKGTIWVPVQSQKEIGLRLLTNKRDLARFRTLLKSRPTPLSKDHAKRHQEIVSRMKEGSLEVMCEVVRDLAARSWHKPLTGSDSISFRRAREALFKEWAAADGVSIEQATEEVEALLTQAHKAHK